MDFNFMQPVLILLLLNLADASRPVPVSSSLYAVPPVSKFTWNSEATKSGKWLPTTFPSPLFPMPGAAVTDAPAFPLASLLDGLKQAVNWAMMTWPKLSMGVSNWAEINGERND
jgi:hypothetical protein